MALWKARSLTPEQKMKFVEQESETKTLISEDSCPFLVVDDVSMAEIYSCSLPIPVISLSLSHTHTRARARPLQTISSFFEFFVQFSKCSCV